MLISKIYKIYKYRIYQQISDIRGATRLLFLLRNLVERDIENVNSTSKPVRGEEWDNLIILDGCRFDLYEEVAGSTSSRITLGSSSAEFIEENFSDHNFSDTVLITGNPHFHNSKFKDLAGRNIEDVFHEVFHTYQTDWDEEKGTVMPEPLVRDSLTAEKLFPDKKKIIHMMQPHHPFVESDLEINLVYGSADPDEKDVNKIWSKAERGEVERERVWDAYRSNLEFVLEFAYEINEKLEGRTIITSDHGNLVGEKDLFGHPYGSRAKSLRKVPWDVISEN